MSFVDFILNLAGLLLWFSWRSMHFDPLARRKPATLLGTLRPAGNTKVRGWLILVTIPALLFLRAILYWQIGAPADWTPKLDIGIVVIAFRVDSFLQAFLFSVTSFLRLVAIAYTWLLALSLVNRRMAEPDPVLRLIRLQLGKFGRLPPLIQVALSLIFVLGFWAAFHPLLSYAGVLGPERSASQLIVQGLLVAGCLISTLKLLFPAILLMHMLTSYVYLGSSPFWDFILNTSRNLLSPLPTKNLRTSKLDLSPLVGILVILLLLHTLPTFALRFAASQGITVWPE